MIEQLLKEASTLLNREVEVQQTKDGKYIVLYMSFSSPPPPKGENPEEALERFIEWFKAMPKQELPEDE